MPVSGICGTALAALVLTLACATECGANEAAGFGGVISPGEGGSIESLDYERGALTRLSLILTL